MTGSILEIATNDLDNAEELTPIETTEEVKIRISNVKTDLNKNNEPYLLATFEAPEFPKSKSFTKYFGIPNAEMDAKKKNSAGLALKKFFQAFDVDYAGGSIDLESLIGREAWAILGVEKPNEDSEFGPGNYIKKFVGNGN
jgi:hypothetical protein